MHELTPYVEPTLAPHLEAELRSLIAEHQPGAAIRRMENATGLPHHHCQAWVLERVEQEKWYLELWAKRERDRLPIQCPYCGQLLKTGVAKQCLLCGMDWHDPEHVVRLGSPKI